MAIVTNRVSLTFTSTITLTEVEMRALEALVCYGDEAFIKAFKENLGSCYIENHTDGLISFFDTVRKQVLPAVHQVDKSRKLLIQELNK